MQTISATTHRLLYPAKNRMVSIAWHGNRTYVEMGDISSTVPKFRIPTHKDRERMLDASLINGRLFVPVVALESWSRGFRRWGSTDTAEELMALAKWARHEAYMMQTAQEMDQEAAR